MRHRVAHRKLGRVTEHRIALLRNQAEALLRHERIETTVPKARELRPFVERLITIAKRSLKEDGNGKPASAKGGPAPSPERAAKVRKLTARRLVEADLHNKAVVTKLFDTIAPRFEGRPGGYTRLLKVGNRRGDNAEVAQIELVGSEYNPALDKPEPEAEAPKAKGVRGRLAAAASRLRGEKKEAEADAAEGETKNKAARPKKKTGPKRKTD
jgi:large subunit ribosomal protein L17